VEIKEQLHHMPIELLEIDRAPIRQALEMRVSKIFEDEHPPSGVGTVDSRDRDSPFLEMLADGMIGVVFINSLQDLAGRHEEHPAGPGVPYAVKTPVGAVPTEGFHSKLLRVAEYKTRPLPNFNQYLSDFRHLLAERRKCRPV